MLILPLSAWSAHRLAWCSWNRWDSNSWLISWNAMSEFLFSQFLASTSASASYHFCWAILSPRTAESTFRSKIFWRFSLSLNECTTFWSRSLFPFDCELRIVETTDYLSKFAPVSWMPLRLSTDSWSRHCFQRRLPKDPNIVGTMLAAVCLLLLDAPECGKPSGSSVVEIMMASSRRRKFRWLWARLIGVCSSSL